MIDPKPTTQPTTMNEIYIGNDPGSPPETICDKCEKCLAGECDGKPCAPHPDWCEEFTDANGKEADNG